MQRIKEHIQKRTQGGAKWLFTKEIGIQQGAVCLLPLQGNRDLNGIPCDPPCADWEQALSTRHELATLNSRGTPLSESQYSVGHSPCGPDRSRYDWCCHCSKGSVLPALAAMPAFHCSKYWRQSTYKKKRVVFDLVWVVSVCVWLVPLLWACNEVAHYDEEKVGEQDWLSHGQKVEKRNRKWGESYSPYPQWPKTAHEALPMKVFHSSTLGSPIL